MAISWTNTAKAKKMLKEAGFDVSAIEKGEAEKLQLTEEHLLKIIKGDPDNILEILNKAGQLAKDSKLTRVTGHKEIDFSSVQTTSYINLTKYCYQQLPNIEIPYDTNEVVSTEVAEEIDIRITKIWRDIYKCTRIIGEEKSLRELVNKELAKPANERKRDFSEVIKMLHEEYKLDTNRVIIPEKIDATKKSYYNRLGRQAKEGKDIALREFNLLDSCINIPTPDKTPYAVVQFL